MDIGPLFFELSAFELVLVKCPELWAFVEIVVAVDQLC